MGWVPDDLHARFFAWKHVENPSGRSPAWVAVDHDQDDRIVGFRTFMRWEFTHAGQTVRATRAVDTATHPEYQGQGIFSALTLAALEHLQAEGDEFVFNTPNSQSLPGYLKMGWREVGRLSVQVRPRSIGSIARIVRARTPAAKWSLTCRAGVSAAEAFGDAVATAKLLEACPTSYGLTTRRTPEFLAWRYGFEPLDYRVVLAGTALEDGAIVFRLRARGSAKEAAITDVLAPAAESRTASSLLRRVVHESGADYGLRLGRGTTGGFVPAPRQGPVLVHRALTGPEHLPPSDWALTLGDVELF